MPSPTEAVLLRIFLGEEDRFGRGALHEAIVEQARALGVAGTTVLHSPCGFGHSGRVRSELNIEAGAHLPIVVEIVDSEARIEQLLPVLDGMLESGLVTLERVRVIRFPRKTTEA
jgi:PII-like signaling protein